ncbi:probable mediator of RNA polymerase II transcription subunit 26b [Lycium ferocissimum]|uniref:probable mediator of RNA polymerase II transcription subunit 26b n=1 Tax=Lycium ferocissimum TaxID=112874 RepID=UPI0028163751|nr:probable mediator of RNA polymerase II transcription subunit 26b [Lycium ferocissimum]
MIKISEKLNKWRDYFGKANLDIFDIIENAVMVAAIDHPKEFKLKRERIVELLFTCKITKSFGSDKVELVVPNADEVVPNEDTKKCKNEFVKEFEGCDIKENKSEMNVNKIFSNYSYGEAEALTDEIEKENQTVKEVLRIKEIIDNNQNESESVIYESLRRLQLMALSVETLKATEIGKSVNALRKHNANNIRHLARTLVEDWKVMVHEWVKAIAAFQESTPESMKASVVDEEEEGLPSPPLEDLAFISTQTTSIEFSKFFDGMDDDGNLQSSGESNKSHENGRKASVENNNPVRKQRVTENVTVAPKDKKGEQPKNKTSVVKPNKPSGGDSRSARPIKPTFERQLNVVKPNKPSGGDSRPGRPIKPTFERKLNGEERKLLQKSDKSKIQKRPVPIQQNRLKYPDEGADHVKLESTKRKLQKRCHEAEKGKRQRTIQVMELHDIPKRVLQKKGPGLRNPHTRLGNHNRHLVNGHL